MPRNFLNVVTIITRHQRILSLFDLKNKIAWSHVKLCIIYK